MTNNLKKIIDAVKFARKRDNPDDSMKMYKEVSTAKEENELYNGIKSIFFNMLSEQLASSSKIEVEIEERFVDIAERLFEDTEFKLNYAVTKLSANRYEFSWNTL